MSPGAVTMRMATPTNATSEFASATAGVDWAQLHAKTCVAGAQASTAASNAAASIGATRRAMPAGRMCGEIGSDQQAIIGPIIGP